MLDLKEEVSALIAELSVLSLQPNCRDEEIYVTRKVLEKIYKDFLLLVLPHYILHSYIFSEFFISLGTPIRIIFFSTE